MTSWTIICFTFLLSIYSLIIFTATGAPSSLPFVSFSSFLWFIFTTAVMCLSFMPPVFFFLIWFSVPFMIIIMTVLYLPFIFITVAATFLLLSLVFRFAAVMSIIIKYQIISSFTESRESLAWGQATSFPCLFDQFNYFIYFICLDFCWMNRAWKQLV